MKGLFAWGGFRQTAVEYDRAERTRRRDQVQLLEAVDAGDRRHHLGLDGAVAVWSYLGGLIAFVGILFAVFVVIKTILFGVGRARAIRR